MFKRSGRQSVETFATLLRSIQPRLQDGFIFVVNMTQRTCAASLLGVLQWAVVQRQGCLSYEVGLPGLLCPSCGRIYSQLDSLSAAGKYPTQVNGTVKYGKCK